jgi:hypothetical protein
VSDEQYLDAVKHASVLADRLDAALRRIEQLESRVADNAGLAVTLSGMVRDRLTARIEALELEVAQLKTWTRPPSQLCGNCGTTFTTPDHFNTHTCKART